MTPLELKEMISEIKAENPEINRAITIIDDSDLSDFANDFSRADNMLLVGVIPSYTHKGNIGAFIMEPIFQMMVLEKADYSDITSDEFIQLYERTLKVMEKVRDFILEKVEDGCYPMLKSLDVSGMEINPVKRKSQFNGWSMDIIME